MMQFHFQYRIWYSEDEIYLERKFEPCVEITEEDYRKILIGVNAGMELKDITGIDDALQKMRDCVLQIDRWKNKDGTDRKMPLKKPRNVYMIEYFLTGQDLIWVLGAKDIEEELNRPETSMRIYSHDGIPVLIKYQHGRIYVTEGTITMILDVNEFLNRIRR